MQRPQHMLLSVLIAPWLLAFGVMLACSGDPSDPWTPLPAATAEPPSTVPTLPTPTPHVTPTVPVATSTPLPTVLARSLPLPSLHVRHGGVYYPGDRTGICWPVTSEPNAKCHLMTDLYAGWDGFDEVSAIPLRIGEEFRVILSGASAPNDLLKVMVFSVLGESPRLQRGDLLFEDDIGSRDFIDYVSLDLPPGIYYMLIHAIWKEDRGHISYGFKVKMVE